MLTCLHCGHQSTDPTPFCAHCGARVEAPAAAPVADDPTGPIRASTGRPSPRPTS